MIVMEGMMVGQRFYVPFSFVRSANHGKIRQCWTGSMMVLSVFVPPGGYDEVDYITMLELVKIIMDEGNRWVQKTSS